MSSRGSKGIFHNPGYDFYRAVYLMATESDEVPVKLVAPYFRPIVHLCAPAPALRGMFTPVRSARIHHGDRRFAVGRLSRAGCPAHTRSSTNLWTFQLNRSRTSWIYSRADGVFSTPCCSGSIGSRRNPFRIFSMKLRSSFLWRECWLWSKRFASASQAILACGILGGCAPLTQPSTTSLTNRPNHAMEPTRLGRRTPKFSMTPTSHPAATRALASGGSSCSR